ncbi:hypothetical protein QYE76_000727 [Lolium multiflorum]|uniref:Ribonuclease H n=1 Tax=Lolium multiflorum TaxID=4521 RepID=A0AAD8RLM6_LOLMU|nr:hypothetical protein QYE76_000727 [Lolium multiflorum]
MAPLDGNDVDDDDDIDAYINTGACSQDMYMPPMDEQAFRTHGDQLSRPPTVTKQRLVFTGLSQDTPPEAGNPAQVKPATVFSPNTLRKTIIGEPPKSTPATSEAPPAPEAPPSAPPAPPVGQVKKGRKRGAKKGASSSQPAPKRIRADDMVPPTPDGLPRCHEAGKPILPPDMEHLASGPMLALQYSIQYQESVLLKEKDPNYPVFSVKVPSDQHFVNEDPADIFFIAFEDVFNLFHSKRLDYNLVRLYAINLQMKINRETPPHREMTYYVVFEGRVPGVYEEWEECKKQVHKFSGNCYKGYPTRHEAVAKWRAHQAKKSKMKTFLVLSFLLTIVAAVLYFILV